MKQRKRLLAWLLSLAMLITGVIPGCEKKAEAKVTAMSPFTIGLNYLSKEDGESVTAEEVSRKIKGDGIYYLSYTATSYTSAIKKLTLSTSLHTADLTENFGLTIKKVSIAGTSYSFYDRVIWGLENGDEAGTYCVNLINPDCGLYAEDGLSWQDDSVTSMNAFGKDMEVMSGEKILIKLEVAGMGSDLDEPADHMPQNPQTGSDGETLWDCVWFGHYGASKRKLPIKWRVLSVDGNDAFLMADQGLDCGAYNVNAKSVTWKTCTLRSWLNGYDSTQNKDGYNYSYSNFMDEAFQTAEQEAIFTTTVHTEDYDSTVVGGDDTRDKIYLASREEACNSAYGFDSSTSASHTRYVKVTDYAKSEGAETSREEDDTFENGRWWLRSPGNRQDCAVSIDMSGAFNEDSNVYYSNYRNTVRPVLHLDLSKTDVWSYAGQVSSEGYAHELNTPEPIIPTPTPIPTEKPDEENQAFLMFQDGEYCWNNFAANICGGNGRDVVITGNGTYTVSLHKEDFAAKPATASGINVLCVDIPGICTTQKFDASQMAISDVIVKCDGKEIKTDLTKMYEGDIEEKGTYRLEICNIYGYGKGEFNTAKEFRKMNPDISFKDFISVTFTITGIKDGKTPEGAFTTIDENGEKKSNVTIGGERAEAVNGSTENPGISPTGTPIEKPTDSPAAIPTAKSSDNPSITQKPAGTSKPGTTGKPSGTMKPGTTREPVETKMPEITGKPADTREPGTTVKPTGTSEPLSSAKPGTTSEPGSSQNPDISSAPDSSTGPNGTADPNTTFRPRKSADPKTSSVPVTSESPASKGDVSDEDDENNENNKGINISGGINPVKKLTAPKKLVLKKGKTKKVTVKIVAEDNTGKTTDKAVILLSNRKRIKISGRKLEKGKLIFKVKAKKKGSVVITVVMGDKVRRIKVKCKK